MIEKIISTDGTEIGYERSGKGQPLVLVHGGTADHTRWSPLLGALENRFTVYAVDRRGRGFSGDREPYRVESEFEDIAALINSITEPVNLLGHSFGGICALEAAVRTANVRRLILYEPPIPLGAETAFPPAVMAELKRKLAEGDRDGLVSTFMVKIVKVTPQELEGLKSSPAWKGRLAAAHTILREIEALENDYQFQPERFKNFQVPTLLLLGGDSPAFVKKQTETTHAALPNSRITVMPGQQHVAMNTAPDLFLREVVDFLTTD